MAWLVGGLGRQTGIAGDHGWIVDSTPVDRARSREAVERSDLAGWAEYGYCTSHSRYFWVAAAAPGPPASRASGGMGVDRREGLIGNRGR